MNTTSLSECLAVTYLQMITNFAFSESIMIFLVWKLRKFRKSEMDNYIVYGLLFTRSLLYIIYIVFVRPQITFDTVTPNITLCDNDANHGRTFLLITTAIDLLIDAYVAFRFIQYIRRNLKSCQNDHLSYKLIIWNSLRISMISIQHINTITIKQPIFDYAIEAIIFIILSYAITFNIESSDDDHSNGNDLESGNNNYKGKNVSNDDTSDDDIVLRASNGMLLNMPLKNVRDEIKMEQKYKTEKLDPNGDVGILKQSLTFYEVASMILGKDSKRQSY
ncbi:hypothetical protein RclHR1_00080035 [Rhizophagus clarus]|nr:hypothetical protein RclHR1_00080035 [Rhizophagus clarus]